MSEPVDWSEVRNAIDALVQAVERLEQQFPGRKFTPDGLLVGSIGEVVATYMFDLELHPSSHTGHDAFTRDSAHPLQVEVKLTLGTSVAIRHEPDLLMEFWPRSRVQRPRSELMEQRCAARHERTTADQREEASRLKRRGRRRETPHTQARGSVVNIGRNFYSAWEPQSKKLTLGPLEPESALAE